MQSISQHLDAAIVMAFIVMINELNMLLASYLPFMCHWVVVIYDILLSFSFMYCVYGLYSYSVVVLKCWHHSVILVCAYVATCLMRVFGALVLKCLRLLSCVPQHCFQMTPFPYFVLLS